MISIHSHTQTHIEKTHTHKHLRKGVAVEHNKQNSKRKSLLGGKLTPS